MTEIDRMRHRAGVVLVVVSALVFSTAGIFTKGVPTAAWDVIFWRGVAAAGFTFVYLWVTGALRTEIRAFGWPAFWVTLIMSAGTAAFIPAFKYSSVANVVLIYGAAPFLAAGLAWVFLHERPTLRVSIASCLAFGGVALIVGGSVGGSTLQGDVLALIMTLMLSATMVFYRRFPATTAALPAALSSVALLGPAWLFGDPFGVSWSEMPALVIFGLVFAIASLTLLEGARRLPAPETALLSTLELPLAPILAIVFLSTWPAFETVIGGAIVVAAVVWSQGRGPGK